MFYNLAALLCCASFLEAISTDINLQWHRILFGSIQIGILADFSLHFRTFAFVM